MASRRLVRGCLIARASCRQRRADTFEVEAQTCFRPVAEPHGSELASAGVDPVAVDVERARERCRIYVALRGAGPKTDSPRSMRCRSAVASPSWPARVSRVASRIVV